jgi:hypothetical protein
VSQLHQSPEFATAGAARHISVAQAYCAGDASCEKVNDGWVECLGETMGKSDAGYDYDRYRRLLAEADDEPKRLAFINLLVDEKAKDKLAEQALHARLAGLRLPANPKA